MEKGFSLFELLVVMSIIAILSAIALPNYLSWRNRAMVDSAAFNIRADLQRAKLEAMKQGQNVYVDFSSDGYRIFRDINNNRQFDEGEFVFSRELEGITVDMNKTSFGGGNKFSFTRFNSRGISPGYFGGVTITSGGISRRVIVDMVGRLRIDYI